MIIYEVIPYETDIDLRAFWIVLGFDMNENHVLFGYSAHHSEWNVFKFMLLLTLASLVFPR